MKTENSVSGTEILQRMEKAMNAHDLDAFVDCFTEDFVSELPLHPQRNFVGRETVRKNWGGLFAHVPDLVGTVLQSVVDDDQIWSEWEIRGNTQTGMPYLARGAAIHRLRDGKLASVRFYLDNVEDATEADG
ncbi:nuclear transport factor 2 family protein [Streptomyces yerevanensis]|uniref:nuclear transport factor 2 family protein n=1 Tax=Streptomyces yerevanensis TaxID=66378 RepID=UPI00068E2C8B|nr:nuclear transport factor 2 family protein [Streptomyces yerevanensis]